LEITSQAAAGLAAIHEQNLVHRDIKPANIMVGLKEGSRLTAKIIDLGLAKAVADAPTEAAISISGAFAGTPAFASPQQFAGVSVDIRFGSVFTGGDALGHVNWQLPIPGYSR
jgi:eukaryotic-like serine/threonine-protein kinase